MPDYHVVRSITINAPIKKVRDSLIDYMQWPIWSPWLITEPDTTLNYNNKQGQVGAAYDWNGDLTGAGEMELKEITSNKLDIHLQFIKPFKSTAKVTFDLLEEGDAKTQVSWNMYSKMPFFLFWMVNKIKLYIGMDYERGLKMLKAYLETGSVPSAINIVGISKIKHQYYIGIQSQGEFKDMGRVMNYNFTQLFKFIEDNQLSKACVPLSVTKTYDIAKSQTSFITAVPVDSPMEVSLPFINGEIEEGDVLKVTHTGSTIIWLMPGQQQWLIAAHIKLKPVKSHWDTSMI